MCTTVHIAIYSFHLNLCDFDDYFPEMGLRLQVFVRLESLVERENFVNHRSQAMSAYQSVHVFESVNA